MKRLLLVALLGCLCLSGCSDNTKVESTDFIMATDYKLSDSEDADTHIALYANEFKIEGIEYTQSVKTYVADVNASRYMNDVERWDWSYTLTLKDIEGNLGFVIDNEELYWLYVGRAVDPFDTLKVDVYYNNEGVKCIIVDDEYLFYSNFEVYMYPEED